FSHLGMSGSWTKIKSKHTYITLQIIDTKDELQFSEIYYEDPRRFGKFSFLTLQEKEAYLQTLGPDILSDSFTEEIFLERFKKYQKSKKKISELLLQQDFVAGLGNIYRCDALYAAKISPLRECKSLTIPELQALYTAIKDVCNASYASGGTSLRDYHDLNENVGNYSPLVYGK